MPSNSQARLDVGETRPPQVVERERRVTNADAVSMAMCAHEFEAADVEGWYTHEYEDVLNEWVLENVEATLMRLLDYPGPHSTRRPMRPPLAKRLEAEYGEGSEQATLVTDGGRPDHDLYAKGQIAWGREAQLAKAAEEFSELAAAVNREQNGQISGEALLEEMADARIMLEQLETDFTDEAVEEAYEDALDDLHDRLPNTRGERDGE